MPVKLQVVALFSLLRCQYWEHEYFNIYLVYFITEPKKKFNSSALLRVINLTYSLVESVTASCGFSFLASVYSVLMVLSSAYLYKKA